MDWTDKWSQDDLLKQMKDKRKARHIAKRVPREIVRLTDIADQVADELEYKRQDIRLIVRAVSEKMEEAVLEKKTLILPGLGSLYAYVRKAKPGVKFPRDKNGNILPPIKTVFPPRWKLIFAPLKKTAEKIFEQEVFDSDIEAMYHTKEELKAMEEKKKRRSDYFKKWKKNKLKE